MEKVVLMRSGESYLEFEGELLSSRREGNNFASTTYCIYRTAGGNFIGAIECWDGQTSNMAEDGILTRRAKVCKTSAALMEFFRHEDGLPSKAWEALDECDLIQTEFVD